MEKSTVQKEVGKDTVVIQQLVVTSADRTPKDISSWRYALQNAESLYAPNRTRLLDLYEEVKLDGHLTGLIEKRFGAVLNKKLIFETKDGKRIEAFDDLIASEMFCDQNLMLLESKFEGVSGLEFIPGKEFEFKPIPRKHIKLEHGVIALTQNQSDGIRYADNPNLWIIGKPYKLGLFLQCCPYAIFKKGNFSDWAQFIEIFGQPLRIGKYDAYDPTIREELKRALDEMGSGFSAIIPKQAEIELMDGKQTNANGELQEKFRIACNEELSVVALGNTETTSKSKGSGYAIAKEHGDQQLLITYRDMAWLLQQLNSKFYKKLLTSYGFPAMDGHFSFEEEKDLDKLIKRLEIDLKVSDKVPIDDDYWYTTYGIDKPNNYNELKAKMEEQRRPLPPEGGFAGAQQAGKQDGKPVKPKDATKPKAPEQDLADAEAGFWTKLRHQLADFFAPAP